MAEGRENRLNFFQLSDSEKDNRYLEIAAELENEGLTELNAKMLKDRYQFNNERAEAMIRRLMYLKRIKFIGRSSASGTGGTLRVYEFIKKSDIE
jgi:hypothetical protein